MLGYITNQTRRFYVYVSNRVDRIRKSSSPEQWRYVRTELNPADLATRSVKPNELGNSTWLTGPDFLHDTDLQNAPEDGNILSESSAADPEVRPDVKALATEVQKRESLGTSRFARFSQWLNLLKGISRLIKVAQSYNQNDRRSRNSQDISDTAAEPTIESTVKTRKRAEVLIIKTVQQEAFPEELDCVKKGKNLTRASALVKLNPFIDTEGLLRVGGRLERADLTDEERHPVILPGSHHVTALLVTYLHNEVKHQGRHFTQGIIRARGYWIIGGKRLVCTIIHQCMPCRKLRGRQVQQKMADLPAQCLTPSPPFTCGTRRVWTGMQ